jgi:hypothetical protein
MPDTAIARGFLKPEDSTQAWSVIEGVYATLLSQIALKWLTDNRVITTEQVAIQLRSSAASALGRNARGNSRVCVYRVVP